MNINDTQVGPPFMVKCFMSVEEMKNAMVMTPKFVSEDFAEKYNTLLSELSFIATAARLYIHDNWKNVKDWSELSISFKNKKRVVTFYKYEKTTISSSDNETIREAAKLLDDAMKDMHNPVDSVSGFSLDPTDYDTFIKINKKWYFIEDEQAIIIANYIEQRLKNTTDK